MQLQSPFYDFDPLNEKFPTSFPYIFADIAEKASQRLNNWTIAQIRRAWDSINWMFEKVAPEIEAHIQKQVNANQKTNNEIILRRPLYTPAAWLRLAIDKGNIDKQGDFPDAKWEDYFAVLALGMVTHAFLILRSADNRGSEYIIASRFGTEAMEAICFAEQLAEAYRAKTKNRLQAQDALTKRHSPKNKLLEEFFEFYDAGEFKSDTQAARQFYKPLLPERKQLLSRSPSEPITESKAVRTLTSALRKRRAGKT